MDQSLKQSHFHFEATCHFISIFKANMISVVLFVLAWSGVFYATDKSSPVKILCSIVPSLHDNPTASITHITLDTEWKRTAPWFDVVETTEFGTRFEDLRAIWYTHTQRDTHLLVSIVYFLLIEYETWNKQFWEFRQCLWPANCESCLLSEMAVSLLLGWSKVRKLCSRSSCFWSWSFRSFSCSRRWIISLWQMSDACRYM